MTRVYCQNIIQGTIDIDPQQAHHLTSVMRLTIGDQLEIFDGIGNLAIATITTAKKRKLSVNITQVHETAPQNSRRVIIVTSPPKAQRLDWLISKCTELGADHIAFTKFQRTVKLPKEKAIQTRYKNITISAAKQCKRLYLPKLTGPENLEITIESLKQIYPSANLILGSLDPNAKPILNFTEQKNDTIAVIGPEGGMTKDEELLLKENNASQIKLTNSVLRTETAATTFAAILCSARDNQQTNS